MRSSAPLGCGCRTQLITAYNCSDRSPLHDVRQPAARDRRSTRYKFRCMDEYSELMSTQASCDRSTVHPLQAIQAWWSQTGSNRRPPACKAGALPTELWPRSGERLNALEKVVGLGRLELPTSRLSSARSNQLSYKPNRIGRPPSAILNGVANGTGSSMKKEKRRRRCPANGPNRS